MGMAWMMSSCLKHLKTLGVKFNLSVFEAQTGRWCMRRPTHNALGTDGYPTGENHVPSGDYVWMVEMKDGEKMGGTYNGSIDLVR